MKIWEILLIVFCVAVVAGVIAAKVIAKKKGKPSCDCGCDGCSGCSACQKAKEDQNRK